MTIIKEKIAKALAPTLVITAIFFVTLYFFGMENTMIGPLLPPFLFSAIEVCAIIMNVC
ncbi:MAG: hypothetical protein V8R80_12540 [Eubacterium sp.]